MTDRRAHSMDVLLVLNHQCVTGYIKLCEKLMVPSYNVRIREGFLLIWASHQVGMQRPS